MIPGPFTAAYRHLPLYSAVNRLDFPPGYIYLMSGHFLILICGLDHSALQLNRKFAIL